MAGTVKVIVAVVSVTVVATFTGTKGRLGAVKQKKRDEIVSMYIVKCFYSTNK